MAHIRVPCKEAKGGRERRGSGGRQGEAGRRGGAEGGREGRGGAGERRAAGRGGEAEGGREGRGSEGRQGGAGDGERWCVETRALRLDRYQHPPIFRAQGTNSFACSSARCASDLSAGCHGTRLYRTSATGWRTRWRIGTKRRQRQTRSSRGRRGTASSVRGSSPGASTHNKEYRPHESANQACSSDPWLATPRLDDGWLRW
jgi:hypothetical protein